MKTETSFADSDTFAVVLSQHQMQDEGIAFQRIAYVTYL